MGHSCRVLMALMDEYGPGTAQAGGIAYPGPGAELAESLAAATLCAPDGQAEMRGRNRRRPASVDGTTYAASGYACGTVSGARRESQGDGASVPKRAASRSTDLRARVRDV